MELIREYFADFDETQLKQFAALEALYKDWNEKVNVISRKDIDSLYEKHVLHSLSIAASFDFTPGMEVIDIGTGGGFPGVPLAIFFPRVKFHLVDSIGKKLKVVDDVAANIGLNNLTTQHTRAEDIKNRKFDVAVSRAVAPLADLLRWSTPLLRKNKPVVRTSDDELPVPNGLICLKGGDLASEISQSNARPRMMEINQIFEREFFGEKFIVYVPLTTK
ncbi:MAG: 16S rRNA (guanine(527)-N(7))-methyltransferase RsmG [Flavitalea sp.]